MCNGFRWVTREVCGLHSGEGNPPPPGQRELLDLPEPASVCEGGEREHLGLGLAMSRGADIDTEGCWRGMDRSSYRPLSLSVLDHPQLPPKNPIPRKLGLPPPSQGRVPVQPRKGLYSAHPLCCGQRAPPNGYLGCISPTALGAQTTPRDSCNPPPSRAGETQLLCPGGLLMPPQQSSCHPPQGLCQAWRRKHKALEQDAWPVSSDPGSAPASGTIMQTGGNICWSAGVWLPPGDTIQPRKGSLSLGWLAISLRLVPH